VGVYDVVVKRRSIRRYRKEPIPNEHLKMILDAARLAPSAGNRQPWHFVVVTDEKLKRKLVDACMGQSFIADAYCVVVGLGDREISPKWCVVDTTIAMEHMVLVATDLGYGTCWIGAFDEGKVRELLKIPDRYVVVALLTIGVPDESPPPRPRKSLREITSRDVYGRPLEL